MGPVGVKGRRGTRVPCEVHGCIGLISRKSKQVSKVLGRQVSKVEGDPGLIMRFKGLEGHSK